MNRICTCRFCHKTEFDLDRVVKYGTRHYAHFACYLAAGKHIEQLSAWQVGRFPARLLRDAGLLEVALAIVNGPRGENLFAQKLEHIR